MLHFAMKIGKFPESYHHAILTAIPKKGGSQDPLKQRLLTIYPAPYRIETHPWYRLLAPWLNSTLDPDLHGGVAGHECIGMPKRRSKRAT